MARIPMNQHVPKVEYDGVNRAAFQRWANGRYFSVQIMSD